MFKELKKSSQKGLLIPVGFFIIAAGVLLWFFGPGLAMQLFTKPIPMETLAPEELEGKYVSYNIPYLLDYCSEEISKNTKTNVKTSRNITYLMPFEEKSFMGLEVASRDYDAADKLMDDTYDYLSGNSDTEPQPLQVIGTVEKMGDIVTKHFYQTVYEDGWAESEDEARADNFFQPYVLTMGKIHGQTPGTNYIWGSLGIVLILIAIFMIVFAFTGGYQKKVIKTIREAVGEDGLERASQECSEALVVGNARFGKEWTFYTNNLKSAVLRNSDVIWAYQYTISRKGVKSYYLMLGMENRSKHQIDMPNANAVTDSMNYFFSYFPRVVLGYDKNIEQMFKKRDPEFDKIAAQQHAPAQSQQE